MVMARRQKHAECQEKEKEMTTTRTPLEELFEPIETASSSTLVERLLQEEREEQNQRDSFFSVHNLLAHGFFLLGSVLYVLLAVWDLCLKDNGDDDEEDESGNLLPMLLWDRYDLLSALAPLMYLLNAVTDLYSCLGCTCQCHNQDHLEILVAATFGFAASCDMLSVLIDDELQYGWVAYWFGWAACHLYMAYAVLAVLKERRARGIAHALRTQRLELTGEFFLVFGSVVDVVVSYLDTPLTLRKNDIVVNTSSLVSAALWLLVAILDIALGTWKQLTATRRIVER